MTLSLVEPSEHYLASFLEALSEHEAEGETHHRGWPIESIRANPGAFLEFLKQNATLFCPDRVPETTLWGIVNNQYVGRISLRGSLTRFLWETGGHIGYDVRPTARSRGYATAMLKEAVPRAYGMGLLRVMITCKDSNIASKRVIEKSGAHQISSFRAEADNSVMLRYWLPTYAVSESLQNAINASTNYLESPEATRDVSRDPYWPKWNSPWWHMHCLREIGLAHRIPKQILRHQFQAMEKHYIPDFPFSESDLPPDADPYRSTQCHCQKGCFVQLGIDCQLPLEDFAPSAIEWFKKYQLPDGGLNCDNEVYLRERPVSSFVSTAPVLEALLDCELLGVEIPPGVVDNAARFFVERKLHRSLRTGITVQPEWAKNIFPRFYEYDLLRGMEAVTTWLHCRGKWIDEPWFHETLAQVTQSSAATESGNTLRTHANAFSIQPEANGNWTKGRSTSFAFLDLLSQKDCAEIFLQCHRNRVLWCARGVA